MLPCPGCVCTRARARARRSYQTKLAQVHAQLKRALTPSGQSGLRGDLVRITGDGDGEGALMYARYRVLNPSVVVNSDGTVEFPDETNKAEGDLQGRHSDAETVLWLSFAIACLLTVLAVFAAWNW